MTEAGPEHLLHFDIDPTTDQPTPYVHVRARLQALIARSVFYDLVALGEIVGDDFGVWSHGVFFPMAPADHVQLGADEGAR